MLFSFDVPQDVMSYYWAMPFFALVLILFIHNVYADPIQADNTDKVEIINLHVQPPIIKVGDAFTINATLVNNSLNPIYVIGGCEEGFFHTIFNNHITVIDTGKFSCTANLSQRLVNPDEKITTTSPLLNVIYRATAVGTANATVTFSYFVVQNQSDPNHYRIWNSTSKSFLFTIHDNNGASVPEFGTTTSFTLVLGIISSIIILGNRLKI